VEETEMVKIEIQEKYGSSIAKPINVKYLPSVGEQISTYRLWTVTKVLHVLNVTKNKEQEYRVVEKIIVEVE
jgi:hypothetical protein